MQFHESEILAIFSDNVSAVSIKVPGLWSHPIKHVWSEMKEHTSELSNGTEIIF